MPRAARDQSREIRTRSLKLFHSSRPTRPAMSRAPSFTSMAARPKCEATTCAVSESRPVGPTIREGVGINDYSPQFPLRLMNKDFQLILKAAAQEQILMPVTEAAFRVNSDEMVAHNNEEDFSAVLRRMEESTGIAAIHFAQVTSSSGRQSAIIGPDI